MKDFVRISLETHLFFARIMKEHSLFLEAGFVPKDKAWVQRADLFRRQFEDLLRHVVRCSNRMISSCVLESGELVTPFTAAAERGTSTFSGIPIDSTITEAEQRLQSRKEPRENRELVQTVRCLNERALCLVNRLIEFKEKILNEVEDCRLFTVNYPLLIAHVLREAKLYRDTILVIMDDREDCIQNLCDTERFWNQIMMEHALFIRGLLDPSEEELIRTANRFAMDYEKLLEQAKQQDCRATRMVSLEETKKLREFKTAGTKGILECKISSIMLPLLADHVLRESSHYIRILEYGYNCREN